MYFLNFGLQAISALSVFLSANFVSGKTMNSVESIFASSTGIKIIDDSPAQDLTKFINLVDKCRGDSITFFQMISDIRDYARNTEKYIIVRLFRSNDRMPYFQTTDEVNEFSIDLDDLEIFPNPIKSIGGEKIPNKNDQFIPVPGHPPWAEYLCSALGHELVEHLSMMKNAQKAEALKKTFDRNSDRAISHYQVANQLSDQISKDYFHSNRVRGEDCWIDHLDHSDRIIEIKPDKAIVLHDSARRVDFESTLKLGMERRHRLAYITYEENFVFSGRKSKNDHECR